MIHQTKNINIKGQATMHQVVLLCLHQSASMFNTFSTFKVFFFAWNKFSLSATSDGGRNMWLKKFAKKKMYWQFDRRISKVKTSYLRKKQRNLNLIYKARYYSLMYWILFSYIRESMNKKIARFPNWTSWAIRLLLLLHMMKYYKRQCQ